VKKILVSFILVFYCTCGFSQGRFFLRGGGGIIYYNGDLNDRILTHANLVKPALTAAAGFYLFHRASIGVHYYHGKLLGNDAYAEGSGYQQRNLNFQTWINEFSLLAEISLFPYRSKKIINPFIAGGIGIFTFNPKGERDGELTELQPLGTEGQYIEGEGYPAPYKLTQAVAPVAIGFYVRMNAALRLRFEISNHFTFTDYLDDTSKSYPDSSALAATPNGPLAVLFSSRRKDGKFPPAGQNRGNNLANDSYTTIALTLVYNPWIGRLDGQRKNKSEMDKCFGF
jgi:hypothetical protein